MSRYAKKVKGKDEDNNSNNKFISLNIADDKPVEKHKTIWAKIEDLKNIELDTLSVYDGSYIKTRIRTYGYKVYTNSHSLNVPEVAVECGSFKVISIDSLLVYDRKFYLQVYLDNCVYKIFDKQTIN